MLHVILTFPSELWATFGVPSNFNNRDPTSLELLDLAIHDFERFL
jgi:hypothetical protein